MEFRSHYQKTVYCFASMSQYRNFILRFPKKEGLDACREALDNRTKPLVSAIDEMLAVISIVLDNNNFSLGDSYYIQTDGVVIGSRLGKNFACSYMRKWDEQLMAASKTPVFYKRFIDDGFGVWIGSLEELEAFAQHANSIHQNIKVDLQYSTESIEFLDTLVKIENGHIYTDLFVKSTDKQLYLRNNSCHPPSTKKSLAYGFGFRIRRICEKEEDYTKHRAALKTQLRKHGYSGAFIENQLQKVDTLDRSKL